MTTATKVTKAVSCGHYFWRLQTKISCCHFCTSLTTATSQQNCQTVKVTQRSIKNPKQMIDLELSVVDTYPGDNERPTVFSIHGCPGSGMDFEPLISQLAERGIRFVSPTFPGFEPSIVEPWKLLHMDYTTAGRVSLTKSITEEMKLDRIDMLMCHSAGAWAGYKMAAEWNNVHSLFLLNPVGARPHKSLRPFPMLKFLAWLLRQRSLHFLLMPFMERIYEQIGFSGVKAGEHLMVAQQIVVSQGFENMPGFAAKIRERRLPVVFAYTLNDKIIEEDVYEDMLMEHLGVPPGNVQRFTQNKASSEDSPDGMLDSWYALGLQFTRGGHVIHKACPSVILDHILNVPPLCQKIRLYHQQNHA